MRKSLEDLRSDAWSFCNERGSEMRTAFEEKFCSDWNNLEDNFWNEGMTKETFSVEFLEFLFDER